VEGHGTSASSFALFNLKGDLISYRTEIKKKNLLVAFFASYCIPCRAEIPKLVEIANNNQDKVKLLLINIDKEGAVKAVKFLSDVNVNNKAECLLDMYQHVVTQYIPEKKIPAFFLINKNGKVLMKSIGDDSRSIKKLQKVIKNIK